MIEQKDWFYISSKPSAIKIIGNNFDKVNWSELSANVAAEKLLRKIKQK